MCQLQRIGDNLLVAAVRTRTASNAVIAYCGRGSLSLSLTADGVPAPDLVRERRLDKTEAEVQYLSLSHSTTQRVTLDGPGVSVVQFITKGGDGE